MGGRGFKSRSGQTFFQTFTLEIYIYIIYVYSLRHRECGVRGYMHEFFVSKTRTIEVRASEGF